MNTLHRILIEIPADNEHVSVLHTYLVARVPVAGDYLSIGEKPFLVDAVVLATDGNEPVAYARLKRT